MKNKEVRNSEKANATETFFNDLKNELIENELRSDTFTIVFDVASKTMSSELVATVIPLDNADRLYPKAKNVTRKPHINGIEIVETAYDDTDRVDREYEYGEEYEKRKAALLERSGIHDVWWGGGRYDFDSIECERPITESDVEFLNRHCGTRYTVDYFRNGGGSGILHCENKSGCVLVFKNGIVLIEDYHPLCGRGYLCDFENDEVSLEWMS